MRKIFCFIHNYENIDDELKSLLHKFDSIGEEVYLYTDISGENISITDILYTIDQTTNKNESKVPFVFITNIGPLFQAIYRLYHQIFDYFLYFHQDVECDYSLNEFYQTILSKNVSDDEMLYKTVYSNQKSYSISNLECMVEDYNKLIDSKPYINNDMDLDPRTFPLVRKYYNLDGFYYLFEPVLAEKQVVINLNMDKNDYLFSRQGFIYPGFNRMVYDYQYNYDLISRLLNLISSLSGENIEEIYAILEVLEQEIPEYYTYVFQMTCCILHDATNGDEKTILGTMLLLSFLLQTIKTSHYFNRLLKLAIESNVLTCDNKYYIWNQGKRYLLSNKAVGDSDTHDLMKKLYVEAFKGYEENFTNLLKPIPKEERNQDIILIFTIQFLSERHAPTRTVLERCYTLSKLLGKKIILINTKEQYTQKGIVLLHQSCSGSVIDEYSNINCYQYKDCNIPFYQPSGIMPSIPDLNQIIEQIRILKPYMIFSVGNGSITADLCGRIVPEAAIGVAFSNLPTTLATFSVIGKNISDSLWNDLLRKGYKKEEIIESTFTFELIPKKNNFNREQFNIPKDKFVLVTVGIRLDTEIDNDFIETIRKTFEFGCHIVFAGYFKRYEEFCKKYKDLRDNSTFVGYCDDILALMEICDLYVNPRRLGGGFSIVEAFHEGKPGVTINTGDISVAAGNDFCVADYEEMILVIKRYIEDNEFYNIMSQKAKERVKVVTDSAKAMEKIIKKIESSSLFF